MRECFRGSPIYKDTFASFGLLFQNSLVAVLHAGSLDLAVSLGVFPDLVRGAVPKTA